MTPQRGMSDAAAVVMAAAATAGALAPHPVPVAAAGIVAVAALAMRRSVLLCIAVAALASGLSARAWDGLDPPPTGSVRGTVTLVTDPRELRVPGADGVRVDVRLRGRRVEARARGDAAVRLGRLLAGERVVVGGTLRPLPPPARRWFAPRHVAGRLDIAEIGAVSAGDLISRAVNRARRAFADGAQALPRELRPLLGGLVLGDDRGQAPEVVRDFRASGLTHLLVVSGGNVAVVLVLAGPVLRRLTIGARLCAGLAVLAVFGVLTRWEPSVLRAVAMAALALAGSAIGRPQPALRILSLAVTALVLVDPLLVHSIAFRLSVAASAGIALLARPLARRLPGPRPVADAVAVTVAAQIGVAPVLLPTFGPLPLATVPANVLAGPAAGIASLWGMAVGVPAGVLGGVAAAALHTPTELLVRWIAGVARVSADLSLGSLSAVALTVAFLSGAIAMSKRVPAAGRAVASAVLAAAVVAPSITPAPDLDGVEIARGARLWCADGTAILAVAASADGVAVLEALDDERVGALDVLVATSTAPDAIAAVRARRRTALFIDPGSVPRGRGQEPALVTAGPFTVSLRRNGARLSVEVTRASLRGGRPPGGRPRPDGGGGDAAPVAE